MIRKACRGERTEKAIEGRDFENRPLKSFECKNIVRLTVWLLLWFSVHARVFIDTPEFLQDPNELPGPLFPLRHRKHMDHLHHGD